jgi:hypothetical protein
LIFVPFGAVIFFGAITVALSFAASKFTSKLIQATATVWGVFGGPLAGIFVMGFFLPFCNSWVTTDILLAIDITTPNISSPLT